jgi:hypothetical protein
MAPPITSRRWVIASTLETISSLSISSVTRSITDDRSCKNCLTVMVPFEKGSSARARSKYEEHSRQPSICRRFEASKLRRLSISLRSFGVGDDALKSTPELQRSRSAWLALTCHRIIEWSSSRILSKFGTGYDVGVRRSSKPLDSSCEGLEEILEVFIAYFSKTLKTLPP